MRYIAHKKSVYIGLGISILPKHWDEKSLMVRIGETYCQQYNQVITKIHNRAKELIMANYFSPLPIEQFRERLKDRQTESANFKFLIGRAILKGKIDRNPYEHFAIKKCIKAQNEDVLTEAEVHKHILIIAQDPLRSKQWYSECKDAVISSPFAQHDAEHRKRGNGGKMVYELICQLVGDGCSVFFVFCPNNWPE